MKFVAGVDVGSTQTKAVILGADRVIKGRALVPTGANVARAAQRSFDEALKNSGVPREDVVFVVGTGYGRFKVTFGNTQVTEISCHARGACFLFPNTKTIIDMGGQDTKVISIGPGGEVADFCMNDKCAAGTGRFLSAAAETLGMSLDDIGPVSLKSSNPVRISSVCAVFVESDIMSFVAQKKPVPDILAGVHKAIAVRTVSLARRVGIEPEVTFTGGVARNVGMVKMLEEVLGVKLNTSEDSHFMGAIGAALYALELGNVEEVKMEAPNLAKWDDGFNG